MKSVLLAVAVIGITGMSWSADTTGVKGVGEIIGSERRMEWKPGIPGGIPAYAVFASVKDAAYGAKGDGVADDTAAIQKAIDDCPAGKAVLVPAGVYRLTEQIKTLGKPTD